ncbi:MAG: hypothetical protein MR896_00250 [Clostridiales bacterium]|nr:hypothetical protein [Clostridiales bacterium]
MAERRMFAKSVINSARFLRMPATSRLLYYDLGMQADDDGIVEAFTVMRTTGATEDDLRVLMSKGFVTVLNEDFVTFINDWKRNNLIKNDRYRPSVYADLLIRLTDGTQVEPDWNLDGTQVEPQDRIGKDRIGKDNIGKGENAPSGAAPRPSVDYQSIVDDYNKTCISLPKCTKLSDARRKAIAARLRTYTREEIHRAFALAQESEFMAGRNDRNWTASFDWIMKDTNMAKILDGNYNNRKGRENDAGNQFAERFSQYTI